MYHLVVYSVFLFALTAQFGYAVYFFVRIFRLPTSAVPSANACGATIIICAKNEVNNLATNLPKLLTQHYFAKDGSPFFEVIVVNDASTDDTEALLNQLSAQYNHLKVVNISQNEGRTLKGKKYALSKGVMAAQYDWLALIDADCTVISNQWLTQITAPLAAGKEIVAGFGGYISQSGLLNSFIRWETLHTFLQYSTYAQAGLPYMAVGRNMACTKQALMRAQQADVWNALPGGDDDLLVRIAATSGNTAIVCHPSSFTYTESKPDWTSWARQKQRHLSAGKYYKPAIKALLGGYALSHAAMWVTFFVLVAGGPAYWVIGIMAIRCALYWTLWAVTAYKTQEKKLLFLFPAFDLGWLAYNFAFLPYITWKNKQQWT